MTVKLELFTRMVTLLEDIYEDLEDRYDGAPDAHMPWMVHHLHNIPQVIAEAKAALTNAGHVGG